jgi:mRNA-degrading endonuclease toxin of MazEF toxin-antitoxin module
LAGLTWRRGCIYRAKLPDVPDEEKTVLVVSAEHIGEFMKPIVVQVTSSARIRTIDTAVELRAGEGGLERNSYALCHQIATLEDDMIEETPLGAPISPGKLVEVNRALAEALDLPASWPAARS